MEQIHNNGFPLYILLVKIEQQKELRDNNSKLSAYMHYRRSGYYKQALNNDKIICYDSITYIPKTMRQFVIHCYHLHLKHLGDYKLANGIHKVCYRKDPVSQKDMCINTFKLCQQFKNPNWHYKHKAIKIGAYITDTYIYQVINTTSAKR